MSNEILHTVHSSTVRAYVSSACQQCGPATPSHNSQNGAQAEDPVMFWYVVSLLGYTQQPDASTPDMSTSHMVPYALVLPFVVRAESDLHSLFVDVHASNQMLQLWPFVHEVLYLHACDKSKGKRLFDAETREVSYAGRLIDGDGSICMAERKGALRVSHS
jgi:hypothetical protein